MNGFPPLSIVSEPPKTWLAILVSAAVSCFGAWSIEAGEGASPDKIIVITQKDIDAFARAQQTTPTAGVESAATDSREGESPVRLETCYSFPVREYIYWEWLETGALGLIAQTERQMDERSRESGEMVRSRAWSEQLQRELDRIDDEVARLEEEREKILLTRVAALSLEPNLSTMERTEAAVLYMAVAQNDLDNGRAKRALEMLDQAGKHLPQEPLVRLLRGIALREAGRNEEARAELRAALDRQPRLLLGLIALAEAYEDNLAYDEAAELWDRARQASLGFPHGLARWADRNRGRFPDGEASLRRVWSEHLLLRLRLARLHDLAHRFYQSHDKAGYTLVYDPSIGVPRSEEFVAPLRELVRRYLENGEGAVDRGDVERLFDALGRERDQRGFDRLMGEIADYLATAERDIGREIGHRASRPPVVVLHNPNVWETLVAGRWTLGLYKPLGRSISVYLEPLTSPRALKELKNTIYHEYGHFATFDITGPRGMPLWLAEGLAEFLALQSGYDRYVEDPVLARWSQVWANERVERPWFAKGHASFGMADYYKARRAVELLAARFGSNGLNRLLAALGDGADLDEASRAAFEMDYRALQRYLVKRLPSWTGP